MGNPWKKARKAVGNVGRIIDKHAIQPTIKPVKKPIQKATGHLEKYGTNVRPTYNTATGAGVAVNVKYSK